MNLLQPTTCLVRALFGVGIFAAGSAMATGKRSGLRTLGIDLNNEAVRTLLELAHDEGRATGIVTNASLTDAGAAAFYAKSRDARDTENIAAQLAGATRSDAYQLALRLQRGPAAD